MSLAVQTVRAGYQGLASSEQADRIEKAGEPYLVHSDLLATGGGAGGHTCSETERYFQQTLCAYQARRKEGEHRFSLHGAFAVYDEGKPIGLVKRHKCELLLAVSTVKDSQGRYPVIRGGVYMTDASLHRDDNKPRWGHTGDELAARYARRLDPVNFSDRYDASTIGDVLDEAAESMAELRHSEPRVSIRDSA